jgi:hypothetical protein
MEQDTNTQDVQVEEVAQEAPAQEAPVGLTLQDLRVLAGSIELGAQRGAYKAPEMEIIGGTYNKLAKFLEANTPAEAPAEAPVEDTEAPANEAVEEVTETAE